jgi:hypothetical protein
MIILPNGFTPEEIRVLQEYRRLSAETLSMETIRSIRHPAGEVAPPTAALVSRGYLTSDGDQFTITQKGKDFLAIEATPELHASDLAKAASTPADE